MRRLRTEGTASVLLWLIACQSAPRGAAAVDPPTTAPTGLAATTPPPEAPARSAVVPAAPRPPSLPTPSGLAFGEVTETSVRVWSRCDREARLHAEVSGGGSSWHASALVNEAHDFAATLPFSELTAGTRFRVQVWCSEPEDDSAVPRPQGAEGTFATAKVSTAAEALSFAWGGDVGGQNVCRDAKEGYPIFEPLRAGGYAFFIALGDMIYADTRCAATGRWGNAQVPRRVGVATTLKEYQAHWRYNREDAKYQAFLATTPYYGVWDDHEVLNDWGPKTDVRRGEHLMPVALQAMLDYNPFPADGRLYRRYRWGQHAELFFLDARQYRDENARVDSAARPKQLLGAEQVTWLLDGLARSDATWKFVISSVPLSIPTGLGSRARDGFADFDGKTGFEQELRALFLAMRERKVGHTVWLTTDVHIAAGFSYQPFPESPEFVLHEFVSGPLSAGFFPRNVYDSTFHPTRLFTWAVDNVRDVKDYAGAKKLLNFGDITIDAEGRLRVGIVNAYGERVKSVELTRGKP